MPDLNGKGAGDDDTGVCRKIPGGNLADGGIGSLETSGYEEFGGDCKTGTAFPRDLCVAPCRRDLQDALDLCDIRSETP